MDNLVKDCKVMQVSNGAAAGTTEVDTNAIDTAGFDGVMLIASLGTVTSTCVLQLTTKGSTTSGGTYAAQGAQTPSVTDAGGASSNTLLIADTLFPAGSLNYRYIKGALTRTTANAVVNNIVAILYRAKSKPTVADASVLASAFALGT